MTKHTAASQPDDPLRRPSLDASTPFDSDHEVSNPASPVSSRRPSQNATTSTTPQRRLRPFHPTTPSSSQASPQPLIRISDDHDIPQEAGGLLSTSNVSHLSPLYEDGGDGTGSAAMTSDQSYGALDSGAAVRRHHPTRAAQASAPAAIEADDEEEQLTNDGDSKGMLGRRPRQFSFKKRRVPTSESSAGDGNIHRANFLNRASIAAFGRGIPSITSSRDRSAAQKRDLRRIHTISINGQQPRLQHAHLGGGGAGAGESGIDTSAWERKPRIPSLMPAAPSPNSTPIPKVPFIVLCLVCFGEFSSAGVAGPFLFFQIESFKVGGEGEVGYWAGVVASVFFFAQFLTSLLWASAAQKHGRRAVLLVSLLGNSLSLIMFGMSTNLRMAISVRLAQGLFNGAVGVAKGAVRDLTDSTNEGRAMAQLGFAWGMGGIVGPLLGGLLCNPVDKFPALFGGNEFLTKNPYVLPCLIVASFTAMGAFLTLFIGPDGGPRTGAIYLPEKADVERVARRTTSAMGSLGQSAGKHISGYFGNGHGGATGPDGGIRRASTPAGESLVSLRHSEAGPSGDTSIDNMPRTFTQMVDEETGGPPSPHESDDEGTIITSRPGESGFDERRPLFARARPISRTTARHRSILGGGSAYGYDVVPTQASSYAGRPQSRADQRVGGAGSAYGHGSTQASQANRLSILSTNQYAPDFEELGNDGAGRGKQRKLSFAQRFLLANDDAVLGLSDLWVAAAINNDEEPYDDDGDYDDFGAYDYGDDGDQLEEVDSQAIDESYEGSDFDRSDVPESTGSMAFGHDEADEDSGLMPRHLPPLNFARRHRLSSAGASSRGMRPHLHRLGSGGRIPSVYSNTGVENTPLLSPSLNLNRPQSPMLQHHGRADANANAGGATAGYDPTLAGIPESGSMPNTLRAGKKTNGGDTSFSQYGAGANNASGVSLRTQHEVAQRQQSIFLQLPLGFIAHYALMSLHSSTFDQIFMAYLVTPFKSGGLGLTAAHYAELIAAMAFCQIGFQFVFYPKIGPPQGQLSHLAMMRLGTSLYLPVYVLFAYLRAFLHPSTDVLVMTFMILFASLRFLANVCAFTSVSILMNATTEPHLVPLANGLAQTMSSASRFIGPLLGGMLWAKGVEGGYETHEWPFNYHLGFWIAGLLGFTGFLHTWLIR